MWRITLMHRPTAPNRRPITVLAALVGSFALSAAAFAQPAATPPASPAERLAAVDTAPMDAEDRLKVTASLARWQLLPAPSADPRGRVWLSRNLKGVGGLFLPFHMRP